MRSTNMREQQANGFYSTVCLTMPFSIVFIAVWKIPQAPREDRSTSQVYYK